MPSPLDDAAILITGASSGIGEAFARQLAPRARALVLVARRRQRLEMLAEELRRAHPELQVHVAACDLTDRDAVDRMLDEVARELGGVEVLINNAGFGDMSAFDLADWSKLERMIRLNVTELAYLTHRLAPNMVERGRGGVLNVSSGFGLQFLPGFATYVGTKHFVTGFTEALRTELAGQGVTVTQLCPGPVDTEFHGQTGNFIGRPPPKIVQISAERCARAGLKAFSKGRAMVIPGVLIRLVMMLGALTPRFVLRALYTPVGTAMRRKQIEREGPSGRRDAPGMPSSSAHR